MWEYYTRLFKFLISSLNVDLLKHLRVQNMKIKVIKSLRYNVEPM